VATTLPDNTPSSAPDAPAPPRELLLLLTLAAMQFVNILDFMIIMPLGPHLMRIFELDPQHFGFLVSAYTFAAAASGFVAVFWVDRVSRKRSLLVMFGGLTVATALCGLATSYPLLLAARIVAGAFGGVIGALVLTIVADVVPYARRARGTAIVAAAFSLAAVMGVPMGLWLAANFSWRAPFLALAGLALLLAIVAWRILPPLDANLREVQPHNPVGQLRALLGVPNHLRAFAFMLALMISVFLIVPFIAAFTVTNAGILETELPWLYFAGGLTTLFTAQVIGHLADRYGKKRIFTVLAFISLLPIVIMTNLAPMPFAAVVAVFVLFFVFVPGRFGPAMALMSGSVEPKLRGSFMSFSGSVQQLGSGVASLAAGLIIGRAADGTLTRYHWVGFCAVAFTLLAVVLARSIRIVPDGSTGPE
jgi:predicted MFS family arabinose efflux permease